MIMETVALFELLVLLSISERIYCVKIVAIEGIFSHFSFQLPMFA